MLVLSRRVGEKVVIGDDILLTVLSIKGKVVRLGFDSRTGAPIDRLEIREKKEKNADRK
jgi:carbon storage regulator